MRDRELPTAGPFGGPVDGSVGDAVALLERAGLAPPLAWPAGRGEPPDDAFAPLLRAAAAAPSALSAPAALRQRLLQRVSASATQARRLHTRRHADTEPVAAGPGVTLRTLYRADAARPRRPGEPDTVTLVELACGAAWALPAGAPQRECLVLRGRARWGQVALGVHDHHVQPAGAALAMACTSDTGALLLLRDSAPVHGAPAQATTQRAGRATWADYAPGIKRRILWRQGAQAAMLYHALPGAAVPHHGHRHDEECLMLAGEFFLDDVLLRPLDYQVAPAGTEHHVTYTDTGVVLYAHGDVDLDLR